LLGLQIEGLQIEDLQPWSEGEAVRAKPEVLQAKPIGCLQIKDLQSTQQYKSVAFVRDFVRGFVRG
jgi:hypothetical protein